MRERRAGALSRGLAMKRLRRHLGAVEPARVTMRGFRAAAVAIMLGDRHGVPHVTLTQRAATLRAHSGQVSLPGGVCDPCDGTVVATALRESREEIGVASDLLSPVGILDDEITSTGYVITPVLFELLDRPRYVPNPAEVAQVFEAPLGVFGDPGAAEDLGERRVGPYAYRMRAYVHDGYRITGATARILERVHTLVTTHGT